MAKYIVSVVCSRGYGESYEVNALSILGALEEAMEQEKTALKDEGIINAEGKDENQSM